MYAHDYISKQRIHLRKAHLLADVLVVGAQRGVEFERSLSQLVSVLQVVIQLQRTERTVNVCIMSSSHVG